MATNIAKKFTSGEAKMPCLECGTMVISYGSISAGATAQDAATNFFHAKAGDIVLMSLNNGPDGIKMIWARLTGSVDAAVLSVALKNLTGAPIVPGNVTFSFIVIRPDASY